jgi:hypothetical protein
MLREHAWQVTAATDGPLTARWLADAAGITRGAAELWLREWAAAGRLARGNPTSGGRYAPYAHPYLPPALGRYRVLVTGSRTWTDTDLIGSVLADIDHAHPGRLTIIHGACPRGADTITDAWCRQRGVPVQAHPADWSRHGRRAGYVRNTAMVATAPDACVAFIADHSPGATHCADTAEAAGIPTTRRHHTSKEPQPMPVPPPTLTGPAGNPLLAAALAYAGRGWHVFPLRGGCKRPAVRDWEHRATTDPARIARCWAAGEFNIGIACGPSGLVVLDLDAAKPGERPPAPWNLPGISDGADAFALLCEHAGQPCPAGTYTVTTPSGGQHLYFTAPGGPDLRNTAGRLGWHIDTRAAGGYVVAAGSLIDGRTYQSVHGQDYPAAALPGWLAEHLTATRAAPPPPPAEARAIDPSRQSAYLTAALRAEAGRVRTAPAGQRNHALYLAAVALGQLVAGGAITQTQVRSVLEDAAAAHITAGAYTEAEREATITSGLTAGAKRPRQVAA